MTLLLVSCTTAATPASPQQAAIDATASPTNTDPSLAVSLPTPTAPPSVAPAASPALAGGRLGSAEADFDCDGHNDLLEFFDDLRPGTYESVHAGKLARLNLSVGGVRELAFDGMPFDSPGQSPLIGVADVNGDACDDAIVAVGHGASTIWTSFLVYDGIELRLVEEDGKPAMFLFAGSVRHGNAIECRRTKDTPEIVARATSDYTSEFQWDTVEDVHRWSTKSRLVLWSSSRSVIAVSTAYTMPTDHYRYWGLSCGNVKLAG
jgi:hypothetical protein